MSNIKAVVFDMDGTLIDSRELIYQAMEHVMAKEGLSVTREDLARVTGKPIYAMYEILAPGKDAHAMEAAHLAHHADNMHLLVGYEHVHEVLSTLHQQGIKLGVFTGFDKRAYERLGQFKLLDYFDSIVDATRYAKHKPEPEGLLLCIRELGCTPETVAYIGDGVSDVVAGRAAKVANVIAVTHGFGTRESLEQAGADHTVDSFDEILTVL